MQHLRGSSSAFFTKFDLLLVNCCVLTFFAYCILYLFRQLNDSTSINERATLYLIFLPI